MKRLLLTSLCLLISTTVVLADWRPGDPFKMHQPQMPDPNGWDVFASIDPYSSLPKVVADDWLCTQTGPVSDIHIWGSWKGDNEGFIAAILVNIYENIPADDTDPDTPWSHPGDVLWQQEFVAGEFTIYPYGEGDQGWLHPGIDWAEHDHDKFHQINIELIEDPFIQRKGEIYWLGVSAIGFLQPVNWGWKTSLDHFEDDAVWTEYYAGAPGQWNKLSDPLTGESLDMAFVITPEPTTICLLGLGALSLINRKKR